MNRGGVAFEGWPWKKCQSPIDERIVIRTDCIVINWVTVITAGFTLWQKILHTVPLVLRLFDNLMCWGLCVH